MHKNLQYFGFKMTKTAVTRSVTNEKYLGPDFQR